jgi:hypothetical protein
VKDPTIKKQFNRYIRYMTLNVGRKVFLIPVFFVPGLGFSVPVGVFQFPPRFLVPMGPWVFHVGSGNTQLLNNTQEAQQVVN